MASTAVIWMAAYSIPPFWMLIFFSFFAFCVAVLVLCQDMWPYWSRIVRSEFKVNILSLESSFLCIHCQFPFPCYPQKQSVWHLAWRSEIPFIFMFFCNEWKINTCLIWGIKERPLLPMASAVTAWHCQIAVRTCNPRGMNDSSIKNGRLGLNTSACFIGVHTGTCVYLPNKWIRLLIHSAQLHRHNLVSTEWCHLKWTCSWPDGV